MRICASCGETYSEEVERCDLDGTPLSSWEEATRVALGPADDASAGHRVASDGEDETIERPTVRRLMGSYGPRPGAALPATPGATVVASPRSRRDPLQARLAASIDPDTEKDVGREPEDGLDDDLDEDTGVETTGVAAPAGIQPFASGEVGPRPGRILGSRYKLRHRMAVGGFGAVFAAEDLRLKKRVAVKVLSPHIAASPDHLVRFQREAEATGQIGHEGIVNVTDFDRDADGTHFIVMELLDGHDLAQVIEAHGSLPLDTALSIAAQVASALEHAHHAGFVHRDLKPANVFITQRGDRDVVKILDFGISKVMHRRLSGNLTQSGQVMGTPYYMAPEQAQGRVDIDGRADVYALGVMLYEMLVGAPPFNGDHYVAVALQHLTMPPPTPSSFRPELSPSIDRLVATALSKEPVDRFPSMAAFHAAIAHEARILAEPPVALTPAEVPVVAVLGLQHDDSSTTIENWVPRPRTVSGAPFPAGQVARLPHARRHWQRTLAFGVAGALALGAIVTVASSAVHDDGDAAEPQIGARPAAQPVQRPAAQPVQRPAAQPVQPPVAAEVAVPAVPSPSDAAPVAIPASAVALPGADPAIDAGVP